MEETLWALRAKQTESEGMLGIEETAKALENMKQRAFKEDEA